MRSFAFSIEFSSYRDAWRWRPCFANVLLCLHLWYILTVERHHYMHHINLIKSLLKVVLSFLEYVVARSETTPYQLAVNYIEENMILH